jgi:hypothetical protein
MATAFVSSVIDAPIGKVWKRVRDFNAMPAWHPAIADSVIEEGLRSDTVGCARSFNLTSWGRCQERLVALSDETHSFTYSIVAAPLPVQNYLATLVLYEVDSARTCGKWSAEFDVPIEKKRDGQVH